MIILSISMFLLACICMALEHKIIELNKYVERLGKEVEEMDSASAKLAMFHSESIGKLTNITEGLDISIENLKNRVENVSHETKDIKSYYCNYITKKGNE